MIKINNLNKTFYPNTPREFQALKDINLHIKEGDLTILEGVSGSGKSTLLSLIAALQKPTSGEIIVDNEQIAKLPDFHASQLRAKKIGFIFQAFHLFESLSVEENISLVLIPLGFSQHQINQKVDQALQKANIAHKSKEKVSNLSGGEKQRCAIARALANDPKIILCDEPTANLDKTNSLKFIKELKELKEMGKTILISTHDPLFREISFSDRIIEIEGGRV